MTLQNKAVMDYAEEAIIHTYNRFPVVLDHGDGVYLYDIEGKKYLDFAAGIAVCALGYNVPEYNEALKAQIDKVIHVSNLYYTTPMAEAAHLLTAASGLKKVFFTNSGTEAIEGAIKLARKYAWTRDNQSTDHEIIAMNHSFHGRSIGALSVTGNPHYQEAFKPLIDKVVFADFNDLEDVVSKINDKTCAIIMETIQGEGGIYPADPEFLRAVRRICDERDILLILMTSAKALGCGVPIGAFVAGEKAASALTAGDHGSTYGGNPLATAAACAVFDLFEKKQVVANVCEVGDYLGQKLNALAEKYSCIKEVRGMGLIRGMEFDRPVATIVARCIKRGLLIISAGTNIIRFVPPLVIGREHVDEMTAVLESVLAELSE